MNIPTPGTGEEKYNFALSCGHRVEQSGVMVVSGLTAQLHCQGCGHRLSPTELHSLVALIFLLDAERSHPH